MARKTRYAHTANPEYHSAIVELRRSGAAGVHQDKRNKRARTRKAQAIRAIKDFLK